MRWYNKPLLAILFFTLLTMQVETTVDAQEISFWETFALSENREKTLEQLVPGSEDWFFFHCLHFQNNSKLDEVDAMLKRWAKRNGKTGLYQTCLLYTSPSPRDATLSRMPSSA